MTTKPNLIGSLILRVVALLLGLAAGALLSRMRRAPEPGTVDQWVRNKEPVPSRSLYDEQGWILTSQRSKGAETLFTEQKGGIAV